MNEKLILQNNLKAARGEKSLSQQQLAEMVGVSRNTISSIENGVESAYTFAFLKTISKVFNCDIGYILGEYEEKTQEVHQMCLATGLSEKAIEKIQYAAMQIASVYACSAIFDEKTKVIEDRQKELEKAIVNLHDALKELEE